MRKLSQLVAIAAVTTLVIGLTAAVMPVASGATTHPASGASVSRTGYITISGEVKLAYDLTLPSATGRFPVALEYNDYTSGADNTAHVAGTDAGDLLAAGFAVLGVNQPGSGCSGGVNNMADVNGWGRAGAQVVEWAARQPWSTGQVGMFGSSWTGMTQLGVASFRPRGLDAITPFHVAADLYRDVSYPGGVYNSAFMNLYAAGLVRIDQQAASGGISRGNRQCIKDFPHITILHEVSEGATTPPRPAWVSTYRSWSDVMKPVRLYFHGNGSLATSPATTATAGQSSFSGPAPAQSGSWATPLRPGTSVSYTTPPLAHDADFFGPGSVNLWLSSTAPDTDIEVIISEVRRDGQEQYVQAGWLDVAQRKLAPAGNGPGQSSALRPYQTHTQAGYQLLTPRARVYARVELFPFEHVFRAGSSIRITIDSATGTVQSTGVWGLSGLPAQFTNTVYAGPSQPSDVVLGLIPGATARAPLPACGSVLGEPCRPNRTPVPTGRVTIPGTW